MGRKPRESDYGLPPLTFAEAARLLGVDEGALMNWVMKLIRLYLDGAPRRGAGPFGDPAAARGADKDGLRFPLGQRRAQGLTEPSAAPCGEG